VRAAGLQGRVVLVTGSSRGLGRSLVLALAAEGVDVVINYLCDRQAAEQTARQAQQQGVRVKTIQADVREWSQVQALMDSAVTHMGRLDGLVNNVGGFLQKPLQDLTPIEWLEMINSNLHSAYYGCKAVLPIMKQQRYGRIINIGVANADRLQAYSTIAAYAIAKTGVQILTRSLAREVAAHSITVNMVSLGLMDTGLWSGVEKEEQIKKVPMGRLGSGADFAAAVFYLLSDQANYITGANLTVSGGWGV